jgi:hypothetical protein
MTDRAELIAYWKRQISHYRHKLATAEYGPVQASALGWIEFYTGMIAKHEETAQ